MNCSTGEDQDTSVLFQFKFLQYETDNNGWLWKILETKRGDIMRLENTV